MKMTFSLPNDDVRFLDGYARRQALDSRSEAVRRAIRLLRIAELAVAYESAWQEWARSDGIDRDLVSND
jgi:Arc/MetJ-type ribon-helix-helix transcriptional regulator